MGPTSEHELPTEAATGHEAEAPRVTAPREAAIGPGDDGLSPADVAAPSSAESETGTGKGTDTGTDTQAPAGSHRKEGKGPVDPAEVGRQLKDRFPALFAGAAKPLKLRIQVDLQERAPGVFSRQALSAFFRRHTASTSYLMAVAKAPHRFDLDGQPAGEIAEDHRRLANEELARRRQSRESRDALAEQQRRNRATLLRDFEQTTLTRANFCALKQLPEADLDGLLEQARQERAERPAARPDDRSARPPDRRPPTRAAGAPSGARPDRARPPSGRR